MHASTPVAAGQQWCHLANHPADDLDLVETGVAASGWIGGDANVPCEFMSLIIHFFKPFTTNCWPFFRCLVYAAPCSWSLAALMWTVVYREVHQVKGQPLCSVSPSTWWMADVNNLPRTVGFPCNVPLSTIHLAFSYPPALSLLSDNVFKARRVNNTPSEWKSWPRPGVRSTKWILPHRSRQRRTTKPEISHFKAGRKIKNNLAIFKLGPSKQKLTKVYEQSYHHGKSSQQSSL